MVKKNTHKRIIPDDIYNSFMSGVVIPALPLALDRFHNLDEHRQRALIRYYLDAGVGGLAVGVHTTQFEIREPGIDLFEPVLKIAREEWARYSKKSDKPVILISGVTGDTRQAEREATLATKLGYHAALLSLKDLKAKTNVELLDHCRAIAQIIPLVGFYLQEAVGGQYLDFEFWKAFARIDTVIGIKIAPFNRYRTLDVVRAVVESGRSDEIALYTGNDDNIVADLLTAYEFSVENQTIKKRIVGGLLGHWSVWTKSAVNLLNHIHQNIENGTGYDDLLSEGAKVTDCNAAFFDAANHFQGVIVGIHEVLRRQGLMKGLWTLNEKETLSPAQKDEIDRVYRMYPELNDDDFVKDHLECWLKN